VPVLLLFITANAGILYLMKSKVALNDEYAFDEIISIIDKARENAFRAANKELINMYWEIGKYVSKRVSENDWGKSVVNEFSDFIQSRYAGIRGFSASNIWRMKQFYETYRENEKLATLLRELTWSHNLQKAIVAIKPEFISRAHCRLQTTSAGQAYT